MTWSMPEASMSLSRTWGSPGAGVAADLLVPLLGAGLDAADLVLGEARVPRLRGILPLVGAPEADAGVAHQHETVGVPVEVRLGELAMALGNILVPDLRGLVDVAVTVENGKSPWYDLWRCKP